jgi:hypothetical protein
MPLLSLSPMRNRFCHLAQDSRKGVIANSLVVHDSERDVASFSGARELGKFSQMWAAVIKGYAQYVYGRTLSLLYF